MLQQHKYNFRAEYSTILEVVKYVRVARVKHLLVKETVPC